MGRIGVESREVFVFCFLFCFIHPSYLPPYPNRAKPTAAAEEEEASRIRVFNSFNLFHHLFLSFFYNKKKQEEKNGKETSSSQTGEGKKNPGPAQPPLGRGKRV